MSKRAYQSPTLQWAGSIPDGYPSTEGPEQPTSPANLTIVGFGPGPWSKVTLEVAEILLGAERIYFRDANWPVFQHLKAQGKRVYAFNHLYMLGLDRGGTDYSPIYELAVDLLMKATHLYGSVVYALAGNPFVFEFSTLMLQERGQREGFTVRVVEGLSCLDQIFVQHRLDPGRGGMQILNYFHFCQTGDLNPRQGALLFQVGAPLGPMGANFLGLTKVEGLLLRHYPRGHEMFLLRPAGSGQETIPVALGELARRAGDVDVYCTLYIPPL